jgi:hypothetical protein
MSEIQLEVVDNYRYRIARDERLGMRTNVLVFSSPVLIEQVKKDQSLGQAMNVATLPGIAGPSLAMPDIHQGYVFPSAGWRQRTWKKALCRPVESGSTSTAACGLCGPR